jgi:hypothetical protein
LVYPIWPIQPWFPVLKERMLETPYLLPDHPKLLTNIKSDAHPLVSSATLKLEACRIKFRWKSITIKTRNKAVCLHLFQRGGAEVKVFKEPFKGGGSSS